jgi:hypothetical protein
MNKLKKLFLILPIIFASFYSCSKNDPTTETPVISLEGKWEYLKIGQITNNQEILTNYQHATGCTRSYIQILPGGILKSYRFSNPNCLETISTGTWTKNNNAITVSYPNQPTLNGEIMELTNTTLKTKFINSGITEVEVLIRIN